MDFQYIAVDQLTIRLILKHIEQGHQTITLGLYTIIITMCNEITTSEWSSNPV